MEHREAFKALAAFRTERYPLREVSKTLGNSDMFKKGDEQAPFFTEAFLYNLLGKDDARHLLMLMRNLERALERA